MANFYISYSHQDEPIAEALVPLLEEKEHVVRWDKSLTIGMPWRERLWNDLVTADGVVLLWSAHTPQSQYVLVEIGATRASPHPALLPVVIGEAEIPFFLQDLHCQRIPNGQPATLQALADKLDVAVQKHVEERDGDL